MTKKPDIKKWEKDFRKMYDDSLMSFCIGVVSESMMHEKLSPSGANASHITNLLYKKFVEEAVRVRLETLNALEMDFRKMESIPGIVGSMAKTAADFVKDTVAENP